MSKKYWVIVGDTLGLPLHELSAMEFTRLPMKDIIGVPVLFSRGIGVWPKPCPDSVIVTEADSLCP